MFDYIEAMMGLWWVIIFIDICFLVFRYLNEIKPTLDIMKPNRYLGRGDDIDQLKDEDHDEKDDIVDEDYIDHDNQHGDILDDNENHEKLYNTKVEDHKQR